MNDVELREVNNTQKTYEQDCAINRFWALHNLDISVFDSSYDRLRDLEPAANGVFRKVASEYNKSGQKETATSHTVHSFGKNPLEGDVNVVLNLANPEARPNGVFIHDMNEASGMIWVGLCSGELTNDEIVPVAPVILKNGLPRYRKLPNDKIRIHSRFCGLPLDSLEKGTFLSFINNYVFHTDGAIVIPAWMRLEMMQQVARIHTVLYNNGIDYDAHVENFTFELIKSSYISYTDSLGFNINTMPYDRRFWSFNPANYVREHHEAVNDPYKLIVRLIDLDLLRYIKDSQHPSLRASKELDILLPPGAPSGTMFEPI